MTDHEPTNRQHTSGQPTVERHTDVAFIGGSAAGLAAALQIARQRRGVLVIDDGTPRNAPAAHMHGYLGREGAAPSELVAIGREEVRSYGGEILQGRAVDVTRRDDGRFQVTLTGGHAIVARRVLAATGVTDVLPDIPGLADGWGRWVVHCPFCHGYEVRDQALVQIVTHPMGLHPTPIFRHLSERLTVVLHDGVEVDDAAVTRLESGGITVLRATVTRVAHDGRGVSVDLAGGETLRGDAIVAGSSFRARIEALAGIGVTPSAHPSGLGDYLEVDPVLGQTSVPGIFAAGNVTDPSLQVLPSAAHGSRVGAFCTFGLADEDLDAADRPEATRADWENRYAADPVWSANPNGTLVAEATDLTPGRALDVGAGEGADSIWLAEHGWDVTASEISDNALARIRAEAERRGVDVDLVRSDATAVDAFDGRTFDLVSLQYGSFLRSPDQRGLRNLLDAVAPGGTLIAVHHDLSPLREPHDVAEQTRMYDPEAYVGIDQFRTALAASSEWTVEVDETRDRPPGAASAHHVSDVVLRATRRT
jgi:thioredoxin reductase/SAM-dependent methyltransferase